MSLGYHIFYAVDGGGYVYVSLYQNLLDLYAYGNKLDIKFVLAKSFEIPHSYELNGHPELYGFKNLAEAHEVIPEIPWTSLTTLYCLYSPITHYVMFSWDYHKLNKQIGGLWTDSKICSQIVDSNDFKNLLELHTYPLEDAMIEWPFLKFKPFKPFTPYEQHVIYYIEGHKAKVVFGETLDSLLPYVGGSYTYDNLYEDFNGHAIMMKHTGGPIEGLKYKTVYHNWGLVVDDCPQLFEDTTPPVVAKPETSKSWTCSPKGIFQQVQAAYLGGKADGNMKALNELYLKAEQDSMDKLKWPNSLTVGQNMTTELFSVLETHDGQYVLNPYSGQQYGPTLPGIKTVWTIKYTGDSLEKVKLQSVWPSLNDLLNGAFSGTYKLEATWLEKGTIFSFEPKKEAKPGTHKITTKYYYLHLTGGGVAFFLSGVTASAWEYKYPGLVQHYQSPAFIEENQFVYSDHALINGVFYSSFEAAGLLDPKGEVKNYYFLWRKQEIIFFADPDEQLSYFSKHSDKCGDQPAVLKNQVVATTKKLSLYPSIYTNWTHVGIQYPASIPSPKFDASVPVPTKFQDVYYMKGKQGQIALFETKASFYVKLFRKTYPSKFKSCRVKIRSINTAWLGAGGFGHAGVLYNKIYESWNEVTNIGKQYAYSNAGPKKTKAAPVEVVAEPVARQFEPMKGDYVQLYVDGRLTEDFTFVSKLIREDNDFYVVSDIYGIEISVEPLPERDTVGRKAWRQWIPQLTTH